MSSSSRGAVLALAMLAMLACESADEPADATAPCTVTTTQGTLHGLAEDGACRYLGVPYAAPPVGALRFAPPQPAAPWDGVREATQLSAACMQGGFLPSMGTQSEDCLYLNVYAPAERPAQPLPVMVWVHGGSFQAGTASSYDARQLAQNGSVIVVTINYRLGVFGYLALPELDAEQGHPSGSDGIRDQQAALQWVKDEIAGFGGDPDNVTLFGESAGALSACIHVVSPGSRELVRRFILQSGHCLNGSVSSPERAYGAGEELVAALCPSGDPLACLRAIDAPTLARWLPVQHLSALGQGFYPLVDGPGGVLPDQPEVLLARGEYDRDAELIIGTNAKEGGLFDFAGIAPRSIEALDQMINARWPAIAREIKSLYPAGSDELALDTFRAIFTDGAFRCPARDLGQLAVAGGSTVYLYSYEVGRAFHGDELLALFELDFEYSASPADGASLTVPSLELRAHIQGYWTRFAATGDPNDQAAPRWPAYSADPQEHLVLKEPVPFTGARLQEAQCELWRAHGYPGWQVE